MRGVKVAYRISQPNTFSEARDAWAAAKKSKECLVLTPKLTEEELGALLKYLPETPPKGAVLTVFTSGTVGAPKPVFHSLASIKASAMQVAEWLKDEKGILCTLSPWSMAGFLFGTMLGEISKLKVFSLSDSPLFAGAELIELANTKAITHIVSHPYHLEILAERDVWPEIKKVKLRITSFTAPLPDLLQSRMESFGHKVMIGYGMSEAGGPVLVGGKTLGAKCKLSDTDELLLEGPQLMLGADKPFPTGDLFKKTKKGFEWRGRIRELIDVAGRKIAPNLVEDLVTKFKGVRDCFAYAVPDEVHGQRVALLVEGNVDEKKFQKYLEKTFSPELLPREWKILPEFPRLPSGKKNKKRLKEAY
jgi:acyl-coenzyme A synthetase/AMP-(fatty) acid ligase